jgi:hypothetical protein
MALDKHELIRKYMRARIGAPIVELCEAEVCSIDEAVETCSTRYWTALPYQTTSKVNVSITSGDLNISLDTLKTNTFTDPELNEDAFFLGIGRYDLSGLHNISPLGTNYFDQRLLGKDFGYFPSNRPMEDPRYLADRTLASVSTEDMLFGNVDYRHDIVKNELVFTLPPVEGTLHLWYNWGFCPERTIELLPMVHFDLFKKLASYEFLDIVLSARSGITLNNADYQLDLTELTQKRDALKEELDKDLADMATVTGVWG